MRIFVSIGIIQSRGAAKDRSHGLAYGFALARSRFARPWLLMPLEHEPRQGRKNLSALRGSFGSNLNHGLRGVLPNVEIERDSPPLQRRGGRAINQMMRSFLSRADGREARARQGEAPIMVLSEPRSAPYFLEITNHPGCALKERGYFINGTATPPLKGGECFSHQDFAQTKVGQLPLRPWLRSFAAPRLDKDAATPRKQEKSCS
jgi:hypothetical protein